MNQNQINKLQKYYSFRDMIADLIGSAQYKSSHSNLYFFHFVTEGFYKECHKCRLYLNVSRKR